MKKYKGIVFDVDGTLINNEAAVLNSLADTLKHYFGKKSSLDELSFCLGIPGKEVFRILNISDESGEIFSFWERKMYEYANTAKLFDGIEETLQELQSRGVKLGIVTSRLKSQLETEIRKYPVFGCISYLVCADDVERPKPAPDSLFKLSEESGILTEELLYVGDSPYDSQCAHAAGVDFALPLWGSRDPSIPAQLSLSHPSELLDGIEI